tara:strand:+ start:1329 stop:1535 length:207 start_codon:yes stop_codon:yes gene_type:complete
MTQDDLDNGKSEADIMDIDKATKIDGVTDQWFEVSIRASVTKPEWDLAVASSADALVLVRWLDSKRNS